MFTLSDGESVVATGECVDGHAECSVKLVVRPLIGCLTHTHFWEGPCRAGRKEDMTVEAETKVADETFKSSVEALKDVISEVEFKEALDVRYNESFVVEKEMFDKIGEDVDEIDCFLCMGWRIPKLERYRKPVIIWQNGRLHIFSG